jgi:hypothetical protein
MRPRARDGVPRHADAHRTRIPNDGMPVRSSDTDGTSGIATMSRRLSSLPAPIAVPGWPCLPRAAQSDAAVSP